MAITTHHGVRVFQSGADPVLVNFVDTSVIGLLMAVDPTALPATASTDTPILIQKPSDAEGYPDAVKDELDTIFDQGSTRIVLVLVDEGADATEAQTAAVGDATTKTGIHAFRAATGAGLPKPKLLVAPGLSAATAADGIASVSVDTPGSGYSDDVSATITTSTGSNAELEVSVVGGEVATIGVVKPGYGYDALDTITITDNGGTGTGAAASLTVGEVMNPVSAEAMGICEKLRAQFYADGPDTTDADALSTAQLFGSKHICLCDPKVLKFVDGVTTPFVSSTVFAAQQAAADRTDGPHYPASNRLINGIQGVSRSVEYGIEATTLNEAGVNTIVNRGDGFRTWGPMTTAVDTIWQFVSVKRVADLVNESIEDAFVRFNDRPQTRQNLDLMVIAGREALKRLENEGILLPGSQFYLSGSLVPADGAEGIVKFAMRYEPPAPIYDVRITAYRNIQIGYELLYNSVTGQVDTGAAI
ncbi:phage tail sheath subtilisin-like domain-containing protein [Sediminimonas qiaohouensis]|uniref:phage tail sheath subtilisin-like domain-containing protein n=1 Tax=Sediminimonas qiaohouensis TaxID=552061 RepID=UPI0003F62707|nr:phage tail sheath subtilisin-like domain-containing protein [Sediminimonas qiaohouensis]